MKRDLGRRRWLLGLAGGISVGISGPMLLAEPPAKSRWWSWNWWWGSEEKTPAESEPSEPSIVPPRPSGIEEPIQKVAGEEPHAVDAILEMLNKATERLTAVRDYSTILVKQEEVGGKLGEEQVIEAKFRRDPASVYLKWTRPDAGREALFVKGENKDRILVHEAGFQKFLTGVSQVEPSSPSARRDCRLTAAELGLDALIDRLRARFQFERQFRETSVELSHKKVGLPGEPARSCLKVSAVHPGKDTGRFSFHTYSIYFDKELSLPIRVEGYAYPDSKAAGEEGRKPGRLVESYTYLDLRLNAGLTDIDFSPRNPVYHFSRFS